MIRFLFFVLLCSPTYGLALTIDMPANASRTTLLDTPLQSFNVATGPWDGQAVPMQIIDGTVTTEVWTIDAAGLTTLQILSPFRQQLDAGGYDVIYECRTEDCGGFDFRFAIDVAAPPDMRVDLGDFRYIAAKGPTDTVALVISKTAAAGFVQITRIGADQAPLADTTTETLQSVLPEMAIPTDDGLPAVLENTGHMALSDLRFESGSSTLGPGPFESLVALSDYLLQNPDRRIALVGHTDSSGSLEGNIALSRQRATSVQTRLIEAYGVPSTQLEADGTGYLAPIASNLTAEGREANRRVEAVLLSTE